MDNRYPIAYLSPYLLTFIAAEKTNCRDSIRHDESHDGAPRFGHDWHCRGADCIGVFTSPFSHCMTLPQVTGKEDTG